MTAHRIFSLAAACLVLCSCGERPGYAKEPVPPGPKIEAPAVPQTIDFKGIVPGESGNQELVALLANDPDCKRKVKGGKNGECRPSITYGGEYRDGIRLVVKDGALYKVTVHINPLRFDSLYRDLHSKFGPPSWEQRTPMQNAFGVQVTNEEYLWNAADGSTLRASKYLSDITTGFVLVSSKQSEDDLQASIRAVRSKSGKADL